jgi:hypothetical protein
MVTEDYGGNPRIVGIEGDKRGKSAKGHFEGVALILEMKLRQRVAYREATPGKMWEAHNPVRMITSALVKIGGYLGFQNPGVNLSFHLRAYGEKTEGQLAALVGMVENLEIPEIPTGTQGNSSGPYPAQWKGRKNMVIGINAGLGHGVTSFLLYGISREKSRT